MNQPPTCTAFEGSRMIASGSLGDVAARAKKVADRKDHGPLLIFDDRTAETIEVDLRGTLPDVLSRLARKAAAASAPEPPRGPGRPKLGVVAKEVTLLPRHWDWLMAQPGGASVTLRKLVEQARRANQGTDRVRVAREALYRFTSVMAGNAPGFEEATRALFAGDRARFEGHTQPWPKDVRAHAMRLADAAFEQTGGRRGS